MARQIDAVYEDGVLRPLQPLGLREHERVVVSIVQPPPVAARSRLDVEYLERVQRELAGTEVPSRLDEVRERLSQIPGSMAAGIVAERGDY